MSIFRTLVARVKSPFTIAGLALPKLALRFVDGDDYKNMKTPDDPVRDGLKLYYSVKLRNIRDVDHDGVLEILDLSGYNNHGKIYGAKLQLTF
jgi:hypothetical protein